MTEHVRFTENGRALPMVPHRLQDPMFSVIVCTRNRAGKLKACLDAIATAMAAAPRVRSELIVVNNGSEDDTAEVLARWAGEQSVKVILTREPAKGLSKARNKGLAQSSGEVIIMTDDDCVMQADYLQQAARFHKHPYLIGGKVLLGDEQDLLKRLAGSMRT
jgi:glycosyltransferase involved in cell wall biosynthesis